MIRGLFQFFRFPASPFSSFEVEKEDKTIRGEYQRLTKNIRRKYFLLESKGSLITRLLIDYRASIIAGGEISISGQESTVEALKTWIEEENLEKKLIEYTQLAEREGRIAIVLYKKPNGFGLRALPWHQYKYKLIYDEFETVIGIRYNSDDGEVEIRKPYLIYMQYAGQEEYSDEAIAPPKIAYCLNDIEEIDEELKRWSNINHFFADPTPHFDTDEDGFFSKLKRLLSGKAEEASPQGSSVESQGRSRRWKIGEGLVTYRTKLEYVQADMRGVESLDRHIQVRAQRISSLTGFPIFLLYPELMSNRATSKEIASESNNAMIIERRKHEELWTEIFKSYCIASNILTGTAYNPMGLYAVLPNATPTQVQLLVDTYLPLFQNKVVTKRTFQEMLPGIDPDIEAENAREEKDTEFSGLSNALLNMGVGQ
jgi:hypothetical protein